MNPIIKLTGTIRFNDEDSTVELVCNSDYLEGIGLHGEQVFECWSSDDEEYYEYVDMLNENVEVNCRRIFDDDPSTPFTLEVIGKIKRVV